MALTDAAIQRVNDLNLATVVIAFRRAFKSTGKWSLFWGGLCVLVAFGNVGTSLVGLIGHATFAVVLIGAGIFALRSQDAEVIRLSAITIGLLAVWSGFWFVMRLTWGALPGAFISNPLVAIFQGYSAWQLWQSYSVYAMAKSNANPVNIEYVRQLLAEMKGIKPEQTHDVVSVETSEFFDYSGIWFAKFMPGVVFWVKTKKGQAFGSGYADEIFFSLPEGIELEPLGEKWMSSKRKAKMFVNGNEFKNATFTPEMWDRIEALRSSYAN